MSILKDVFFYKKSNTEKAYEILEVKKSPTFLETITLLAICKKKKSVSVVSFLGNSKELISKHILSINEVL
jgi:hypothetical protein